MRTVLESIPVGPTVTGTIFLTGGAALIGAGLGLSLPVMSLVLGAAFAAIGLVALFFAIYRTYQDQQVEKTLQKTAFAYADRQEAELEELEDKFKNIEGNSLIEKMQWIAQFGTREQKSEAVEALSDKNSPACISLKEAAAQSYFKPYRMHTRKVRWLSRTQVQSCMENTSDKIKDLSTRAFYYHATSSRSLESILKNKKIEVRHQKVYRGAFVSTSPEKAFGNYVLALKKKIEWSSPVLKGFQVGSNAYWAGFSQPIPVNEDTLEYIIAADPNNDTDKLQQNCSLWAGREIEVVRMADIKPSLERISELGLGVPIEWPA